MAARPREWDFDNNGTVDSNQPSPVYTYRQPVHTAKLTVTNSLGTNTMTRSNYVAVVAPQPSTFEPLPPARLLDTRVGNGLSGMFVAGTPRTFRWPGGEAFRPTPSRSPATSPSPSRGLWISVPGPAHSRIPELDPELPGRRQPRQRGDRPLPLAPPAR